VVLVEEVDGEELEVDRLEDDQLLRRLDWAERGAGRMYCGLRVSFNVCTMHAFIGF
jgi:hypothetical protein